MLGESATWWQQTDDGFPRIYCESHSDVSGPWKAAFCPFPVCLWISASCGSLCLFISILFLKIHNYLVPCPADADLPVGDPPSSSFFCSLIIWYIHSHLWVWTISRGKIVPTQALFFLKSFIYLKVRVIREGGKERENYSLTGLVLKWPQWRLKPGTWNSMESPTRDAGAPTLQSSAAAFPGQ